jgi:hypothetical protein
VYTISREEAQLVMDVGIVYRNNRKSVRTMNLALKKRVDENIKGIRSNKYPASTKCVITNLDCIVLCVVYGLIATQIHVPAGPLLHF